MTEEEAKKKIHERRLIAAAMAKKNPNLIKLRDAFDLALEHPELIILKKEK